MAAAQLCIDTDILIDYLRGHSDVLEQVVARLDCALTAVTVFELEIGLARSPRQAALFNSLMDLLMVLPLDRELRMPQRRYTNSLVYRGCQSAFRTR